MCCNIQIKTYQLFLLHLSIIKKKFSLRSSAMHLEEVLNDFWENYSYLPKFDSGKKLEIKEKLKRYVKINLALSLHSSTQL